MFFLDLPTEILELIGHSIESEADINALLQTNRLMFKLLRKYLYKYNASFFTGSALLWAVRNHRPQTAHYALQNGVESLLDWDREPLHCAAEIGDRDMALLLLQYEAGVDCRKQDKTPLYVAAAKDHADVVELLLQNGAYLESNNFETTEKPNVTGHTCANNRYNTPLHAAAYHGHIAVVKLLLEKGADIEAENSDAETPLTLAVYASKYDVFWLLLYNLQIRRNIHDPAIVAWDSTFSGPIEIVRGLLERGVDPNSCDEEGYLALTGAAMSCNWDAVSLLIQKGADFQAIDDAGDTALGACVALGRMPPVEILLFEGADPTCRDIRGNTPLHSARDEAMAELLIRRGASVDAVNDSGQTPLDRAVQEGNASVERFLRHRTNPLGWSDSEAE